MILKLTHLTKYPLVGNLRIALIHVSTDILMCWGGKNPYRRGLVGVLHSYYLLQILRTLLKRFLGLGFHE